MRTLLLLTPTQLQYIFTKKKLNSTHKRDKTIGIEKFIVYFRCSFKLSC